MKRVSVIIPCYFEEQDIENHVSLLKEYLSKMEGYTFDIVLVNDGSKDKTEEVINQIKDIHPISYSPNRGKGYAIREGFKYALENLSPDYLMFMDADLSTDLSAMDICLAKLDEGSDIAIGSRFEKDSDIRIKQPLKRRFVSKCCRLMVGALYHFGIKDSQCGFKGMNKETAELLVSKSIINGFSFDVEYLYIAKLYQKKIEVFPVIWTDDRGSTVKVFKSSFTFFTDLFKIKRHKKKYLGK